MASHASHCTTTLGIRADLAALHNHKHLLTATPSPGQSPLPQLQPTALAPPRAASSWVISHRICGTAVYKSWGLLQVVYHLLVTIHYSNSSVKPTGSPGSDSILDENQKNNKDAAIPKNSHDHIYGATALSTALSQPLHNFSFLH